MAKCATCQKEMPEERIELGLFHCSGCTDQTKAFGVMEYGHKTGGVLVVTDEKGYRDLRKPANSRR